MDLQEVLKLLELMEQHKLDEIEVEHEGKRIRLKKAGAAPIAAPMMAAPVMHAAPAAPAVAPAAAPAPVPVDDKDIVKVTSPMVGTFYRSPSPDAEPFVSEGDHVGAEQVVCIIEAMKVMNEIKVETEGEVVRVFVENGESVEYGQPLFAIRRSK